MRDHAAYITTITESAWSNLTQIEREQIREALAALQQDLAETREREMAWNHAALDEKARASTLETALRAAHRVWDFTTDPDADIETRMIEIIEDALAGLDEEGTP